MAEEEIKPPKMGRRWLVFKPNHRSFGEFILSDQMRKPVAEVAEAIAEEAKATANRDNSNKRRVHSYADNFKVNVDAGVMTVGEAYPGPRVEVDVYNDDIVALFNEFGNKKSKRHRTLGRAGSRFGDWKLGTTAKEKGDAAL